MNHPDPEKYLTSYIKTYLREEVLQEGITRNIALFSKFLEVASFSQGQVLNYTEIAREVGSNRHTINNFFDILEDLLIGYRLQPFTKQAKRKTVLHQKFYYFDVGIFRQIRPLGPLDIAAEADGPSLETLFFQEAKAINDYYQLGFSFYYWRTHQQDEVDFIAYGKHGLFAFEIKRKQQLTPKDLKGLNSFAEDYPIAKLYVLYGGSKIYHEGKIIAYPYSQGLKNLKEILTQS